VLGELKILGLVGVAAAALLAYQSRIHAARVDGEQQCSVVAVTEGARLSAASRIRTQEIVDDYRKEAERLAAAGAARDRDLERLRRAGAAAGASAASSAPTAGADAVAELGRLLAEGGGLAAEGSRRLGEAAAQVSALQAKAAECTAAR